MRRIILHVLLALLAGGAVQPVWALNPGVPPGGNFDLSHWYLQLPTENGVLTGTAGSVDSASATQLVTGFTNAYLYTGTDGAMTFWAPDDGATTGGSTHPRSELRELLNTNDNSVNWTLYGTHVLTATCVVSNVPADTGKVCIGQIHEPDTQPDGSYSANNEEMIMFDLANQTIYANINLDGNSNATFSTTFISGSGVALGKAINYTMSVVDGVLQISINGVTNAWNLFSGTNYQGHVATNWGASSGNTVYFKAGDYNQTSDSCGCSTDGARVAFYSLVRYHAASITNEPAGQAVVAGNNASFTVAASGNGMLSYQWWYNATNRVGGATNATFTLTNVSGTNAGNYTVTVSDNTSSFSTVTSSVAVLAVGAAPAVTNQPSSLSVTAGSNVVFTVGETGTAPLTNHWWFNTNTSLPWAAGNTITITNAQTTNAGGYFVVVNNSYGAVTSRVAVLTVNVPPAITNQPASEAVNAGSNAMFNVGTTGTGQLDYQWWFNATNLLAGSTNAMLTIANVSGASAGGYTVVVSNNFGSVTSAIAVLTVIYPQTVFAFTNAGITNWICPGGVAAMQVECWGGRRRRWKRREKPKFRQRPVRGRRCRRRLCAENIVCRGAREHLLHQRGSGRAGGHGNPGGPGHGAGRRLVDQRDQRGTGGGRQLRGQRRRRRPVRGREHHCDGIRRRRCGRNQRVSRRCFICRRRRRHPHQQHGLWWQRRRQRGNDRQRQFRRDEWRRHGGGHGRRARGGAKCHRGIVGTRPDAADRAWRRRRRSPRHGPADRRQRGHRPGGFDLHLWHTSRAGNIGREHDRQPERLHLERDGRRQPGLRVAVGDQPDPAGDVGADAHEQFRHQRRFQFH